jgi:predicted alpha/beta hydrolase family esterase
MKQVYVLHDAFVKPTDAWYQSIASIIPPEYSLVTPELPAGNFQGKKFWMETMNNYQSQWNESTILITHGITSLLAIELLSSRINPIRTYISIAGTSEVPRHKIYEPIAESFLDHQTDWSLLTGKAKQVIHIWNESDPFIEQEFSQLFAQKFPGVNIPLSGTGHFTEKIELDLFEKLQPLFEVIKNEDNEKLEDAVEQKEQQELEIRAKASIPGIITYDTAVAQSVAGYQGKVISELLASAKADEVLKKEQSPKNIKNIGYMVGTALFFIIAIGTIIYVLIPKITTVAPNYNSRKVINTFMRVEQETVIDLHPEQELYERLQELNQVQQTPVPERSFFGIIPSQEKTFALFKNFAENFDVGLPIGFTGKVKNYLYGYYRSVGSESGTPFMLIEFSGYDTLYAILHDWELSIIADTLTLLNPNQLSEKPELQLIPTVFTDKTIFNIPMRVGTSSLGTTVSYGFISDQVLLITSSPDVVEPITRRFIGK